MNVAAILRQKGRAVTTAPPSITLLEVAQRLAHKRIGAIVVVDAQGELVGIVSERDIILALSEVGPDCLTRPVSERMTRQVVTCDVGEPMAWILQLMDAHQIRHVPITRDGLLCGIVSILDVIKYRLAEIDAEARALKAYVAGYA